MLHPSPVSETATHVVLAINPKAGARSGRPAVERLAQLLDRSGYCSEILSDVDRIAERVAALQAVEQLRALVCAGGDGTVAFLANRTPPETPMLVFPLGTENLLAKHLGHRRGDAEQACQIVRRGLTVKMDAGRADGRLFILMAGLGFDADVVERAHRHRDGHISRASYFKPILHAIRRYSYPELRVYVEGQPGRFEKEPIRCRWVFVANLPRYACGLRIVPRACGHDGQVDVCTFRRGSLWAGLWYLAWILLRRHEKHRDCRLVRTRRVRIESDGEVPYQLDGDPAGKLPLEIDVLPQRLRLLVSHSWLEQAEKEGRTETVPSLVAAPQAAS